jgi:glutamyl-tRNA synthetase
MSEGHNTGYDGFCRDLDPQESAARAANGESHTVRLKFPRSGQTVVKDGLRGDVVIDNSQVDDQILLKSDGFPTYHLANVVDDHLMEITDVIRAEEWISSTPKHVFLYEAFGWTQPRFWHLPLLRNADKSKISKRKNPVSLDYYEQIGILPETMVNFLGLLGWSMPDESEKFSPEQMRDAFTFDRVSTTGPVFDLAKLEWLNGLYIRDMPEAELVDRIRDVFLTKERLLQLMPLVHERMPRLDAFVPATSFFLGEQEDYNWLLLMPPKKRKFKGTPDDVRKALLAAAERLDSLRSWTPESVEALMRELAIELEWKAGHLFHPMRVAIAGRTAAPPLFDSMCAVGSAVARARIRRAAHKLKGQQLVSD